MVTICWAVKGGAGTTVVVAGLALADPRPALIVDLDGDLPCALGVESPDRPGAIDWLHSDADPERIGDLLIPVSPLVHLLPCQPSATPPTFERAPIAAERWNAFGSWLRRWQQRHAGQVIVDAGTGVPEPQLLDQVDHSLLVTRGCYLALRRAMAAPVRPDGVVLVDEPGHAVSRRAIEEALGAPVEHVLPFDPAIGRAVDAGLLAARLPRTIGRRLGSAA